MSALKRILRDALRFRELAILAVLAIEIGIFAFLLHKPGRPNPMLDMEVLLGIVQDSTVLCIAALGACMVIVSGGIDLSVGSNIGLSCVLVAFTIRAATPSLGAGPAACAGVAAGLGGGMLVGLASGALVTAVRLPPFIATLAMMSIARGAAFRVTKGSTIQIPDSAFTEHFGSGMIPCGPFQIPVTVALLVGLALLATFFMALTKWGRQIYAVGGNEEAARFAGVRVTRIKLLVYGLAGLLAGAAGVVFTAYYGTGQSTAAIGWELDAIAAVVVGGGSLSGGRGSIIGACLGAIIFGMLQSGLAMLNMSEDKQLIVGVVIVAVVAFDLLTSAQKRE